MIKQPINFEKRNTEKVINCNTPLYSYPLWEVYPQWIAILSISGFVLTQYLVGKRQRIPYVMQSFAILCLKTRTLVILFSLKIIFEYI